MFFVKALESVASQLDRKSSSGLYESRKKLSVLTCTPCVQNAQQLRCCNATKLSLMTKHPG